MGNEEFPMFAKNAEPWPLPTALVGQHVLSDAVLNHPHRAIAEHGLEPRHMGRPELLAPLTHLVIGPRTTGVVAGIVEILRRVHVAIVALGAALKGLLGHT